MKNNISFGGIITLIKAILANIPIYYMSVFFIPSKVVKKIEQLQRNFLWEWGRNKKDHLLNWNIIYKSRE